MVAHISAKQIPNRTTLSMIKVTVVIYLYLTMNLMQSTGKLCLPVQLVYLLLLFTFRNYPFCSIPYGIALLNVDQHCH